MDRSNKETQILNHCPMTYTTQTLGRQEHEREGISLRNNCYLPKV